jgi:hypothetical protein
VPVRQPVVQRCGAPAGSRQRRPVGGKTGLNA